MSCAERRGEEVHRAAQLAQAAQTCLAARAQAVADHVRFGVPARRAVKARSERARGPSVCSRRALARACPRVSRGAVTGFHSIAGRIGKSESALKNKPFGPY